MRYRDFLVVLSIVAVSAWFLAKPSARVTLRDIASRPQTAPRQKVVGFPIGYVIENDTAPQSEPVPYLGGDPNYGTWGGLRVEDFKVNLTVLPGRTTEDTVFCVTYVGPPGYQQAGTQVELVFDGDEDLLYSFQGDTMAKGWAVFRGSDLWTGRYFGIHVLLEKNNRGPRTDALERTLSTAVSCQAEIRVKDPRAAGPASRGARWLSVQSPPAKLR